MGVFDGSVYRIRARYSDGSEGERWEPTDEGAKTAAETMRQLGAVAIEAGDVFYAEHGNDRLNLSFGDYWGEGEE